MFEMSGREINFKTNKYNKPVLLSKKDSYAQQIQNALFMKRGNCPGHPDRYVDIESYLNKPADSIDQLKLLSDLKNACGPEVGTQIQSLTFQVVNFQGKETALIMIRLSIDNTEDLMAISLNKTKNNVIRYSYNFINDDVPV